mgnify:CR=1 FL=1
MPGKSTMSERPRMGRVSGNGFAPARRKVVSPLAAASPSLDIGALDAIAGVAAIAIERTQFLSDREAAELVKQKADLAATLLASLSHDLRTPLTAIKVAVENLGGELTRDERRTQSSAASSEIDRLTRLFQDILDMARIDSFIGIAVPTYEKIGAKMKDGITSADIATTVHFVPPRSTPMT